MKDSENYQISKTTIISSLAELLVLLLLPLPVFHLNLLYLVTALLIMLLSKYLRKERLSQYGFKSVQLKVIFIAVLIGISFGFLDNFFIEKLITRITGSEPDLSDFEGIKGSVTGLIAMLALGWIVGGLFEESFFRGYLFHRIHILIHNRFLFRFTAITVTSIVFAFAHYYQGITGIVDTFLFSIIMGLLYFFFKGNVWYLILVHGFYDTVGIFKLYLGI